MNSFIKKVPETDLLVDNGSYTLDYPLHTVESIAIVAQNLCYSKKLNSSLSQITEHHSEFLVENITQKTLDHFQTQTELKND